MAMLEISPYFPQFLWKFWLSDIGPARECTMDSNRVHIYDVFQNRLVETRRTPGQTRSIFHDIYSETLDDHSVNLLHQAEMIFAQLEENAEFVLTKLAHDTHHIASLDISRKKRNISLDRSALQTLRKYFTFLHYRNSDNYKETLGTIPEQSYDPTNPYHKYERSQVLRGFITFLHQSDFELRSDFHRHEEISRYCWRLYNSEICLGIASEGQEFMLTDRCYGTLDDSFGDNPDCGNLFFPITPILALYILAEQEPDRPSRNRFGLPFRHEVATYRHQPDHMNVSIDCGFESPSDVHLRNALLLSQNFPGHLYFSSLRSAVLSISSYDEFRTPKHLDYSRLKQRCRQKSLQENVTKTLLVKGSLMVTDLTDEVFRLGDSAVAYGSFSDVWKGTWNDPTQSKCRTVAVKFLRQVMAKNTKDKLLKRLTDEVLAWHRLQHPNIAELHGIVQQMDTIGMVSTWCENGTMAHYLQNNARADRLQLLDEVASGVSYLHNFRPTVIHGDLKGGNILINDGGEAVITDFGLSKVMEELSDSIKLATSFFAGSTRWMAPELVLALVEDDGNTPPITTASDVYAFASVCLEVATGQVPYPHRTNDHSVTVDIIKGVKPSRGSVCHLRIEDEEVFWEMLSRCWDAAPSLRPSMSEMSKFLCGLVRTRS